MFAVSSKRSSKEKAVVHEVVVDDFQVVGIQAYVAALSDDAYEELFFGGRGRSKGKGKGRPRQSSGKGKGRRQNPRDKNGRAMECHDCGSTQHLKRECPGKGVGKGADEATLHTNIEYFDLSSYNEHEGIYLIDSAEHMPEFESETVEYLFLIYEQLGTPITFSDWVTGHTPFGDDEGPDAWQDLSLIHI